MLKFNLTELMQAPSSLSEMGTNLIEGAVGKAFSTDECGSILINSAASGNYGFFEDLQLIASGVEKDGIMEALCYRRLTNDNAKKWKRLIDTLLMEAKSEYDELLEYQPVYLGDFAPKQIGCYKKADKLLKESSFTIKKCMEILEAFTQKPKYQNQRRLVSRNEREWTLTHNILASKTPQTHFCFMYDSFTPDGQQLIESFLSLMDMIEQLMDLCCQTLELEAQTKSDPKQLNIIHDRQFEAIKYKLYPMIQNIQGFSIDEMSMLKEKYTWEEFLIKAYHAFTDNIMMKYTVYQIIMESKKKNIDNDFEKAYLFDDDIKRSRIRRVIENFDDMNPKGREGKLSSFYLAALFKWSDINNCRIKDFFNYFWSIYNGKYTKIDYRTYADAYTLINQEKRTPKYKKFVEDMEKNGFYI